MFNILVYTFYIACVPVLTTTNGQNGISWKRRALEDETQYSRRSVNTGSLVFSRTTYRVEIYENIPVASIITTVRATDANSDHTQDISYSITAPVNQTTFKIDPTLGSITTLKPLDREVQPSYQLVIEAKNRDMLDKQLSSTAVINIIVLDENDNMPTFTQRSYDAKVYEESASSTLVIRLYAYDLDEGQNGDLHYSIVAGNVDGAFRIDPLSGEVFTNLILDHEIRSFYKLRIEATDNGENRRLSTTTTLNIYVLDVNDNAPLFMQNNYTLWVLENVPVGSVVSRLNARDADSGNNSKLTYSIQGNVKAADLPFIIDADTGEILVSRQLDTEKQDRYIIVVKATDHGIPPLSSLTTVEIRVLDANDNKPLFIDRDLFIKVSKNAEIGQSIAKLTAIDSDINDKLTYRITNGNSEHSFEIQTETGIITLNKTLLSTNFHNATITVEVTDGIYSDTAIVHIIVIASHIQTLTFPKTAYQFSVLENQAVDTVIGKVEIANNNTAVRYELLYTNAFSIDNFTGEIKTKETLDRESQIIHLFEVQASTPDGKYQCTAKITVSVIDMNDNAPVFSKSIYEAMVQKPLRAGEVVITVHANDGDIGLNAVLRYSLISASNKPSDFSIMESGTIYISQYNTINQESAGNYTLIVQAVDGGSIPLSAQATVIIKVEEEVIPVG